MPIRITDKLVKDLSSPAKGNIITYDTEVKGFGVRVTAAGARAFILNYRAGGVERRITIGAIRIGRSPPPGTAPGTQARGRPRQRSDGRAP